MTPFFLLFLGLIIGSFLNVVICRLKTRESIITGRSKCPFCRQTLRFFDLIPVLSFVFLRARCRYCRKKISWQYPLVELFTGTIFLLGWFEFPGSYLALLSFYIFSAFLIIIFVYDLKHYLIPDAVALPVLVAALVLNLLLGRSFFNLLLASVLVACFFLCQFLISRGKWIGGGDIRLGLVMGAMLGWPAALLALALAYIVGAVVGLTLIVFKKKKLDSPVPFGTFLTLATLVTLLWGQEILNWYLASVGL